MLTSDKTDVWVSMSSTQYTALRNAIDALGESYGWPAAVATLEGALLLTLTERQAEIVITTPQQMCNFYRDGKRPSISQK